MPACRSPRWACVEVSEAQAVLGQVPGHREAGRRRRLDRHHAELGRRNRRELARAIDAAERFERVLVQRFIEGREFNVGIVGGTLLPVNEIDFSRMPAGSLADAQLRSQVARRFSGGPGQ